MTTPAKPNTANTANAASSLMGASGEDPSRIPLEQGLLGLPTDPRADRAADHPTDHRAHRTGEGTKRRTGYRSADEAAAPPRGRRRRSCGRHARCRSALRCFSHRRPGSPTQCPPQADTRHAPPTGRRRGQPRGARPGGGCAWCPPSARGWSATSAAGPPGVRVDAPRSPPPTRKTLSLSVWSGCQGFRGACTQPSRNWLTSSSTRRASSSNSSSASSQANSSMTIRSGSRPRETVTELPTNPVLQRAHHASKTSPLAPGRHALPFPVLMQESPSYCPTTRPAGGTTPSGS